MKLKYYLRGLGIGIIVTTIILAISFGGNEKDIDDIPVEEVIAKATMLGMVMPEDTEAAATEQQESSEEDFTNDTEAGDIAAADISDENSEIETSGEPEDAGNNENTDVPENAGGNEGGAANEQPADENAGETKAPYRLVVNRGDVCRTVCENLAANGVIDDAETFRKYLSEIGYASSISVGSYDIPYGLTQEEIANVLKNGPIEEQQ